MKYGYPFRQISPFISLFKARGSRIGVPTEYLTLPEALNFHLGLRHVWGPEVPPFQRTGS